MANSAGGVIRSNAGLGIGIFGGGDVILTNSGSIQSGAVALAAGAFATVTNGVGGMITGGEIGINAGTINVMGNGGTIEALNTHGKALSAVDVTVNNKANGIIRANNTNGSAIFGDTVNIIGNSGLIEATGTSGIAFNADISATWLIAVASYRALFVASSRHHQRHEWRQYPSHRPERHCHFGKHRQRHEWRQYPGHRPERHCARGPPQ